MALLVLIDKQDSFELVRDQIAAILLTELAAQQVLAAAAAKDVLDWTLSVYVERDLPIEQWLNSGPVLTAATVPIVAISVESSNTVPDSSSVPGAREVFEVVYNLDVIARGFNSDVIAGGHTPADNDSRLRCQAAVRLVRNILSAGPNRHLGLRSIVWANPVFENFEYGPAPTEATEPGMSVWTCRCRFKVKVTESSPEFTDFDNINLIRVDVSDDGGVILSTEITP